jgi:hypothetical protein
MPTDTTPDITPEDIAIALRPWDPEHPASPNLPPPPPEDPFDPVFTDETVLAIVQGIAFDDTDSAEQKDKRKLAAMHLLRSLDAQQPVEAALATQAVLAYHAALAAYRRAARSPQATAASAGQDTAHAARMSTIFCKLLHELRDKQQSSLNQLPSKGRPRWRR